MKTAQMIQKMANMDHYITAVAEPHQPDATLQALATLANEILDLKQFTMMASDEDRGMARRIYSDAPGAYPVGGEKPIPANVWTEIIFERKETFVGNSIKELRQVFPDWELIQSLGLESCLNLPIIIAGKVVGTLNCLNVAGHFTQERIASANQLKLPGAVAFMLAARQSGQQT